MGKPFLCFRAVCFSLFLAGTTASARSADPLANIHSVLVVSALGSEVAWEDIAFFVPGSESDRHLVYHADWNLDEIVRQKAVEALKARFAIIDESVSSDLLEGLLPGTEETISAKLQQRFAGVTPMTGLDAYVIIHLRPLSVEGFTTTIHVDGLSLRRTVAFNEDYISTAADFQVTVIDARTGKALSSGIAQHPEQVGNFLMGPIVPQEACDKALWAHTPKDLSDLQKQQIRDAFYALTVKSLPYALAEAKLVPPIKDDVDIKDWEGRPLLCHAP